jgi:hypothetical protein
MGTSRLESEGRKTHRFHLSRGLMDVIIGGLAGEIQVSLLMHERLAENIMAKALWCRSS